MSDQFRGHWSPVEALEIRSRKRAKRRHAATFSYELSSQLFSPRSMGKKLKESTEKTEEQRNREPEPNRNQNQKPQQKNNKSKCLQVAD